MTWFLRKSRLKYSKSKQFCREISPTQVALLIHEGVGSSQICENGVQFQQRVLKGPPWCPQWLEDQADCVWSPK